MDVFIGSIALLPYDFAPVGWLACHGQELEIKNHNALFSLLGTRFGGNGRTHFALPSLKDKGPAQHVHYYIATEGTYPSRE